MRHNRKIVLGIAIVSAFLFMVFALCSYLRLNNTINVCIAEPFCAGPISFVDLIPFLVTLGIVVGALTYYLMSEKVEKKEECIKKNIDTILKLLNKDEKIVIERLLENNGKVLQAEITRVSGSKVRAHRVIKKLIERGIIETELYGKTKMLRLKKEIRDGLIG